MRLVRLRVEDFGAIEAALLELGPGLNVLHGPNDLGKSTLAAAVRAALLLQTNSREIDRYRPWQSGRDPSVALTFEIGGRHWRVEKSWNQSTRGQATLAWSNDGRTWTADEEGRGVDGKLRSLLQWGIASPGGRSAPRGLPRSFVAAALLGDQALPYALFGESLEHDTDESAKVRLREALEAMASDPLYQKVLHDTQTKVDLAFTETGKKKTGRDSLFRRANDLITQRREESEAWDRRVAESDAVASRLAELNARCDRLTDESVQAERRLAEIERALEQARARAEAEAHLTTAERALTELQEARTMAAELERREREATALAPTIAAALEHADARAHEARATLARRREEQVLRAQGDDPAWVAHRERLEQRIAAVLARARVHARVRERLATWSTRMRECEEAWARKRQRMDELAALERQLAALQTEREQHAREQTLVLAALAWLARQTAEDAVDRARAAVQAISKHRAESEALRREAGDRRRAAEAARVPEKGVLERLVALERELDVARAALGGGLAVRLELRSDHAARVGVDEQTPRTIAQGELEVERRLTIQIDGVGTITVLAGEQEARRTFERLQGTWDREAVPMLETAGVHELAALVDLQRELDRSLARAREAEREAEALVRLAEAEQPNADALPQREQELSAHTQALPREPEVLAETRALAEREHPDRLRKARERHEHREAELRRAIEAATAARVEAAVDIKAENERVVAAERRVEDARAELEAERVLADDLRESEAPGENTTDATKPRATRPREPDLQPSLFAETSRAEGAIRDPRALAETLTRAETRLEDERRMLDASLAEHDAIRERAHDRAALALADAERTLSEIEREAASARRQADDHTATLAKLRAQLDVRREQLATTDDTAIAAEHARCKDALAALPLPSLPASPAMLAEARAARDRIHAELDDVTTEVRKQEGALQHVGGDVVREKAETAREALEAAKHRQDELELEYEAWRVLRDALRKAENDEGQHLGRVLGRHVSDRFERLTHGRYGPLALGPALQAQGLHTGTAVRKLDDLSEGVKEQLATLLRISVAEHLKTALVLDDHLTQTDPERVEWFRALLQEASRKIQLVVLTCRPADYLGNAAETHTIDLEHVIRRAGV